jgi:hypothetical protein
MGNEQSASHHHHDPYASSTVITSRKLKPTKSVIKQSRSSEGGSSSSCQEPSTNTVPLSSSAAASASSSISSSRYIPNMNPRKGNNGLIVPTRPYGSHHHQSNKCTENQSTTNGSEMSPQWGWYINTTPPTPELYHSRSSSKSSFSSGGGGGGVKRKSAATSTSTSTRTNSIRTKKATDTTGTSLSSSSLLGTTTCAVTPLTSSRNSRTREALCQSDSRNFAKALAGGDDDDNDKNTFLSKRSMILNQGLKLMEEKGGSGSVNGDGVDNDIPQTRSSSIVSRVGKAGSRRKSNRDITSLLQESPRNTIDNIQYGGTNNWNPLNGSRYSDQQITYSSSTRVNSTGGRATYGTLSPSPSLSQESTNRTRSAGRKANRDSEFLSQESPRDTSQSRRDNKTPETIDITNSDSDNDDDVVMEDNQIVEVSSCFPFLVASTNFSTLLIVLSL